MGWTPAQVGQCSLWAFLAAVEGYGRAHGWDIADHAEPMSVERLQALGVDGF